MGEDVGGHGVSVGVQVRERDREGNTFVLLGQYYLGLGVNQVFFQKNQSASKVFFFLQAFDSCKAVI